MARYAEFTVDTLKVNKIETLDSTVASISGVSATGTANGATVVASEYVWGPFHRTTLTCTATPITVADDAGVAQYGGAGKVYDFPQGLIQCLGAVVTGSITMGATGTFIDAWSGVLGLGSAACSTGATLTGTEADFMASTTVSAATAKVATIDSVSPSVLAPLDGTATAKDLYLNLAIADDATHTAGTGTFTGTIVINWMNVGDN